jgi:hypothetical protein
MIREKLLLKAVDRVILTMAVGNEDFEVGIIESLQRVRDNR